MGAKVVYRKEELLGMLLFSFARLQCIWKTNKIKATFYIYSQYTHRLSQVDMKMGRRVSVFIL